MIHVWTRYGENRLYGTCESDLITEPWHCRCIIKGHNSEKSELYFKINLDMYFINLNVITKYWLSRKLKIKLRIMLENQKLHNQLWWPSWIIDGFNGHNFGRRPSKKYLGKLYFIPSSYSREEYQGFPIFPINQKLWQPSWMYRKVTGHHFGSDQPRSITSKFGPILTTLKKQFLV